MGTALALLTVAWGAAIASFSLTDNSFLTHLATGRLILERGSVPTADPYTFTAPGTEWTVQSWIPSVLYASAERLGGASGIHAVVLAFTGVAAWLLWASTDRLDSLLPRIALVFGSLAIVSGLWGERPYMVGVIGMGLMVLALDGRLPPPALVPVFWLWANSHGSFPLGVVLAMLVLIGRRLDGTEPMVAKRVLGWSVVGSLAAVVGPLGLRAVLFPVTALERSSLLGHVVEWQPPAFRSIGDRAFLALVAVAFVCLVRRPSYARALPVIAFTLAAIVAQRNVVVAVMVLAPAIAASLPEVGSLRVGDRSRVGLAFAVVGTVALLAASTVALISPFGDLAEYPARALAFSEAHNVPAERVATQDFVGNLLTALDGEKANVFVDDRVDMLPADLIGDSLALLHGGVAWEAVLTDRDIDTVIWDRREPLGSLLAAQDDWKVVFSDTRWTVACRRTVCPALD